LSLSYVPLFMHAIDVVRHGSIGGLISDETGDRARMFRRYRRQSLWLAVPLVVPIAALVQNCRGAGLSKPHDRSRS
jgi:hypothetical protein